MLRIVLAMIVLQFSAYQQASDAATYKWVDEDGVPHISNRPPPGSSVIQFGDDNRDDYSEHLNALNVLSGYTYLDLIQLGHQELMKHSEDFKTAVDGIRYSEKLDEKKKEQILARAQRHMIDIHKALTYQINRNREKLERMKRITGSE